MSATKKFGKNTTALEVVEGIDLNGYEAVITGGNSGIGVETVRALAKAGARCILCARDTEQAKSVAKDIIDSTGNINVEVEKLELDSLQSIDEFVQRFNAKKRPLNILVNNAGVMASKFLHTRG
jgi:NAD(P)-dependent dehydrogenase (short-subunit alcohol dehydrogenase family)